MILTNNQRAILTLLARDTDGWMTAHQVGDHRFTWTELGFLDSAAGTDREHRQALGYDAAYASLRRLANRGLVAREGRETGRRSSRYRITEAGWEALGR